MSSISNQIPNLDWNKSTILIIDDNPVNLGVAVEYLEDCGFVVLVAQDGESGLQRAKYVHPRLILLDVLLPDLNGFEVCRCLKADESTQAIPVIFMTALSDTGDKLKGFAVGGVDYITKPIQREELLARITTHLKLQSLTEQLQQQNQQLQQQALELRIAKELAETANRELLLLAHLDGLTQVANRRRLDAYLNQEWRRLSREKLSLSLILCDVDHFKRYNDRNGHQAGDDCLQQIAQAINRVVKRPADLVARYGGEEFAIILPNTTVEGATTVAEVIRAEIQQLRILHNDSDSSELVTVSLGGAIAIPSQEISLKDFILAADKALYKAKRQGRDRAIIDNLSKNIEV